MNFAMPLSAQTFVSAAVKVVLPWSTCPIVPMLTCGFFRLNFAFAIPPRCTNANQTLFATILGDDLLQRFAEEPDHTGQTPYCTCARP